MRCRRLGVVMTGLPQVRIVERRESRARDSYGSRLWTLDSWLVSAHAFLLDLFHLDLQHVQQRLHEGHGHGTDEDADRSQGLHAPQQDRKSTRLNSSHLVISYAVFCLKKRTRITVND